LIGFIVIAVVAFISFVMTMGAMRFPPSQIAIATGPADGAYYNFGLAPSSPAPAPWSA
jgi:hypothetical protein